MQTWENKKLVECDLQDYAHAQMSTQGYGRERALVLGFFKNMPYEIVTEHVSSYFHNIAQNVQKKFFEEQKGYKLILECCPDSGYSVESSAAAFEDIEIDIDKTIKGYSNAAIGYERGDDRVFVIIERQDTNDIEYRVFASPKNASLKKEWFELANKENLYRGKKLDAACRFLKLKDISWEDVILPEGTKKLLRRMILGAMSKRHIYKKNGLPLKMGVILSGPPGCGKTSSLKVLAKECDFTVIYAQPTHLGQTKDIRHVCQMAKDLAPTLLILEDLDWIAEGRETAGEAGRVIELMNQLDGLEDFTDVITAASTNDVEKIEKAVRNRPGRFDRVITIGNPDEDCRRRMVNLFCSKWEKNNIDVEKIVKFTDKLSGAHMADLCKTAAGMAIESGSLTSDELIILKWEHFDTAMREVKDRDYSSYLQSKNKVKGVGFNAEMGIDDDD